MKSETIEVAFRYRIRYHNESGRRKAVRLAKEGCSDTTSVGDYGACGAKRLRSDGRVMEKVRGK